MGRSAELVSNAADASQQMAKRAAEQFDQMFTRRIEVSQEVARHPNRIWKF